MRVSIWIPILLVLVVFLFIAYILARDSAVDDGYKPMVTKIPFTNITLTPSRWVFRWIRNHKVISAVLIMLAIFGVWYKI